jgi:hypothetical protein
MPRVATFSPWLPVSIPPARAGSYEVLVPVSANGLRNFAHWDGAAWSSNWQDHGHLAAHAAELATVTHWRGLTERAARRGLLRLRRGRLHRHWGR